MIRPSPARATRVAISAICAAVGLAGLGAAPLPSAAAAAPAAVGDEVIAWVEVEDGVITGGPVENSGDHGNFSGDGSYTFRETGMTSTMSVTAPEAGTYPVYLRYAAGPLGADENVERSMGLLTNGGARQVVQYPMTSFADWETWRVAEAEVTLTAGLNTVAINCDRGLDFCRLNFDAIQVGGTSFDPCAATPAEPGYTSLFDGTLESFDGWRKAGGGGFGRQVDCTIRSVRGRGATWFTEQQTGPYTLEVDWRRQASNDESSVYVASTSRGGADPAGGFRIPIGTGTGDIVATGGTTTTADAAAVAGALLPAGEWNTYAIRLTSSRIKVYLNDTLVTTALRSGAAPANGFVGLENRGEGHAVDFRNIQVNPELGRLAAPFTRAVLADGTANPGGESTLGNLVAEAQRWSTTASDDAQIAFVSPDALDDDLLGTGGYPAPVTAQDAEAVLADDAQLVNLQLTGTQLETVLEQQWQPTRPFLRLGTSHGFTYTYDPTKADGSRITGIRLDDRAIVPATTYSVTVTASLAGGADGFLAFIGGKERHNTGWVESAALVEYLGELADTTVGDGPLAPDATQHAVGVSFPGGAPASYAAGAPFAVDLTSLAYSAASDPKDATVEVSLGGRSLGAFPVDNTLGDDATDEHGTAAVRATIPADAVAGPATVTIVGTTTGTTVAVPITVARSGSTTAVKVAPGAVTVRQGTASVAVTVASAAGTPTGRVELYAGGTRLTTVALQGGRATVRVGPFDTVGTRSITARYLGSTTANPSSSRAATLTVKKAAPRLTVTVQPKKVVAGATRAAVAVAVRAPGLTPTGRVKVKIGAKTYAGTLRNGRVTLRLQRFAKPGPVRATVTYLGDPRIRSASTRARFTVRPRR